MGREAARAAYRPARALQSILAFWRGRYGLVTAFAALHLAYALALLPIMLRGATEGDLPLYRTWAVEILGGHGPMFDDPWVYPAGALLPIVLPMIAGRAAYQAIWLLMIAVLNAAAVLTLTKGMRHRSGYPAAWWFLLFEFLLGPVSMLRLEAVTVPLAIIALVLIARRPAVAGALIAAGAWIKVWPASLAASAFIVSRRRWAIVAGGLAVSAGIVVIVALTGGGANLLSFITVQSDRSLQLEAPIATPWVWGAVLGVDGYRIFQDIALATREVDGPGAAAAASAIGTAMYAACAAILVLLIVARVRLRRLADAAPRLESQLLLLGAFGLTEALIVFNKVGSPQYMLWLVPIVVVGIATAADRWRSAARWLAAISLLTTLVFPIFYLALIDANPFAAGLLTLRNLLVVGLFVATCIRLVAVAIDPRRLESPLRVAAELPGATARSRSTV